MNEIQSKVFKLIAEGFTRKQVADKLDMSIRSVYRRNKEAQAWHEADPAIREAAKSGGIEDVSSITQFWQISKDDTGNGFSILVKNPNTGEEREFGDMIRDVIAESDCNRTGLNLPARDSYSHGENLLVIDLADVHFGKLCVQTEVGKVYNREVAKHRIVEGTKALLKDAEGFGIDHILFVMGNDIINVDDHTGATTAGTNQDTEGSIFQMFNDAYQSICEAIDYCTTFAPVTIVHCMSNHDWKIGWAVSQTVAAAFQNNDKVTVTPYNLSENHRKYFRHGNNLIGLSHGDGAKEEKLYALMVNEARQHIGECKNLYWLLHHLHHKIRKRRGVDVFQSEKDHIGMSVVVSGATHVEGGHVNIEYVRSPSPADGWHHRNGYINRQGVECFLYHPIDGQKARFTEWF